jgi:hypothetical protein
MSKSVHISSVPERDSAVSCVREKLLILLVAISSAVCEREPHQAEANFGSAGRAGSGILAGSSTPVLPSGRVGNDERGIWRGTV